MIRPSKLAALLFVIPMVQAHDWRQADPDYTWSFPRDHWSHDAFRTEWWYFTGHVRTVSEPTLEFGYQFTVFRIGIDPDSSTGRSAWSARAVLMGHAAITDLTEQTHHFSEIFYRAAPILARFDAYPATQIAQAPGPPGTADQWILEWTPQGFRFTMADDAEGLAFSFTVEPSRPIVQQGPNGFSRKNADGSAGSMYYSIPRLTTRGTLTVDGQEHDVRGISWMDREFSSSQLGADQVGWDWFGLQLDDGRDLMVYRLRGEAPQHDYRHATLSDSDGHSQYLDPTALSLTQTGTWRSEGTNTRYPAGWHLSAPNLDLELEVTPLLNDQENVSRLIPDLAYWEGAVRVTDPSGRRIGQGYVELTGYGRTRRPAI